MQTVKGKIFLPPPPPYILTIIKCITNLFAALVDNQFFGEGTGDILYDDVSCRGSEASLADCPKSEDPHNCAHSEDVGLECFGREV